MTSNAGNSTTTAPIAAADAAARHRRLAKVKLPARSVNRCGKPGARWYEVFLSVPEEMYEPSYVKAGGQATVIVSMLLVAGSMLMFLPWYVMPAGWLLLGAVVNAMQAVGRDCSEHVWVPNDFMNDIVGIIASAPVINLQLHRVQSMRRQSAAGVHVQQQKQQQPKMDNNAMKYVTLWPLMMTLATFVVSVYQLYAYGGLAAVFKWWLAPYMIYRFWRLVGTMVHGAAADDTAADDDVDAYDSSSSSSSSSSPIIRYTFPRWLNVWMQVLFQYVNVSIPHMDALHYVPSYRLKSLYNFLSQSSQWSPYLSEAIVGVSTLKALARAYMYTVRHYIAHRLNWLNVIILLGTPVLGVYGFLTTPAHPKTVVWAFVYYFATASGINAGYHRLWSHRAYKTVWPVELVLACFGAGAVQGSIKWWCRNHRIHHRYTDTDYDPYNAQNGFWFAHIGWMLLKPEKKNWMYTDIHDLRQNWIVELQHTWYLPLVVFFGAVFPTLVAGIGWGDWAGGYVYAGLIRMIYLHHSTFCVNSVAHYFGDHTYDDNHTPKDHFITALLTMGEGYHNFHHEFPYDYRNGIRTFDYDPGKWVINSLALFGLAYDLKTFPANEIHKGKVTMQQKKLDDEKRMIEWPAPVDTLPVWSWSTLHQKVQGGSSVAPAQMLVVINGLVHDVAHFIPDHPGGEKLIRAYIGKDATDAFSGGVYAHHAAARNLLDGFRVARLADADDRLQSKSPSKKQM